MAYWPASEGLQRSSATIDREEDAKRQHREREFLIRSGATYRRSRDYWPAGVYDFQRAARTGKFACPKLSAATDDLASRLAIELTGIVSACHGQRDVEGNREARDAAAERDRAFHPIVGNIQRLVQLKDRTSSC